MKNTKGFTLVELIMVIAILSIVSTLAVSRIGAMREKAARRVSIANQQAVGRAVETFLAVGDSGLNRLDALIDAGTPVSDSVSEHGYDFSGTGSMGAVGGLYRGPDSDYGGLGVDKIREKNSGLYDEGSSSLVSVLCTYRINADEADALRKIGLRTVLQHNTVANASGSYALLPSAKYVSDDGTIPQALDGMDAELSACVARFVTNGMVCAAVNPASHLGRTVFQACGQDLPSDKKWNETYDETEAAAEVRATGGPLLAFGLGASASIIGAPQGLDAAPYCEILPQRFYRQYILLFRIRSSGSGSVSGMGAEFAGVLDPMGNTIRAARHALKQ